jgi:hypothetical protein
MYPGVAQRMLSFAIWQPRPGEPSWGQADRRILPQLTLSRKRSLFHLVKQTRSFCDVSVLVFAGQLERELYLQRVRPTVAEFGAI